MRGKGYHWGTIMVFAALLAAVLAGRSVCAEERAQQLLIAAAADLRFALDQALIEFNKAHQDLHVRATYGSSGSLFAQIDQGARFDGFLSADTKFPRRLVDIGKAEKESHFVYAIGHLVIWVPKSSKLDFETNGIQALLDPQIRKVAIANPDVAPYGAAAVAAMKSLGVYEKVQSRLVLAENVSQAAQFVQSGAASAGIISLSIALAPKMKNEGRYWHVPASAFPSLEQAGVICTGAPNRAGAERFFAFLCSPEGRSILERYGFELPPQQSRH